MQKVRLVFRAETAIPATPDEAVRPKVQKASSETERCKNAFERYSVRWTAGREARFRVSGLKTQEVPPRGTKSNRIKHSNCQRTLVPGGRF